MRFFSFVLASLFFFFILSILPANAQVNWLIQVEGMYMKQFGADGTKIRRNPDNEALFEGRNGPSYEVGAGIYLQVPVSKSLPIFIETGLGYRNKFVFQVEKGYKFNKQEIMSDVYEYDHGVYNDGWYEYNFSEISHAICHGKYGIPYRGNYLELPIKCGYQLKINDSNSIVFGFGPYLSFCTEIGSLGYSSPLSVGLAASASFRHRCMSFGVSFQNPVFFNGLRNHYSNSLNITIGINIKGRKPNWDKVLDVMGSVGEVLDVTSRSMNEYINTVIETGQNDSAGDTNIVYASPNSSSHDYNGEYKRWESRAESIYNSMTNLGSSYNKKNGSKEGSTLQSMSPSNYQAQKKLYRDAQKQMKDIRNMARKEGVVIEKSKWETNPISY